MLDIQPFWTPLNNLYAEYSGNAMIVYDIYLVKCVIC